MAQLKKGIAFKKCRIDLDDMTITEYLKDEVKTYSVVQVLRQFANRDDVAIAIGQTDDLPSMEDELREKIFEDK